MEKISFEEWIVEQKKKAYDCLVNKDGVRLHGALDEYRLKLKALTELQTPPTKKGD